MRGNKRPIGISDLSDVAFLQQSIYNDYSEKEQLIRLANHPSLVKTPNVEASAGAGAIIEIPEDLDSAKGLFRWSILYMFGICLLLIVSRLPLACEFHNQAIYLFLNMRDVFSIA